MDECKFIDKFFWSWKIVDRHQGYSNIFILSVLRWKVNRLTAYGASDLVAGCSSQYAGELSFDERAICRQYRADVLRIDFRHRENQSYQNQARSTYHLELGLRVSCLASVL